MASTKQPSRISVLEKVVTIGPDVAETIVHFVGLDEAGQVLTHRQYSKAKLLAAAANTGPGRIGMQAWCGSDHLGLQGEFLRRSVEFLECPNDSRSVEHEVALFPSPKIEILVEVASAPVAHCDHVGPVQEYAGGVSHGHSGRFQVFSQPGVQ